jgi:hypothetical protein
MIYILCSRINAVEIYTKLRKSIIMIKINELNGSKSVLQNLTEKEAGSITGGITGIGSNNAGNAVNNSGIAVNNNAIAANSAANNASANSAAMAVNRASASQYWSLLKAASSQLKAAGG